MAIKRGGKNTFFFFGSHKFLCILAYNLARKTQQLLWGGIMWAPAPISFIRKSFWVWVFLLCFGFCCCLFYCLFVTQKGLTWAGCVYSAVERCASPPFVIQNSLPIIFLFGIIIIFACSSVCISMASLHSSDLDTLKTVVLEFHGSALCVCWKRNELFAIAFLVCG